MRINFRNFSKYYKATAIILLNICLLFIVVNILGFIGITIKESYFQPKTIVAQRYSNVDLTKVYPGFNYQEIAEIQKETQERPAIYEPFTQFKEKAYSGKYVNVSEASFRLTKNQGPWPPERANFNVFLFGGSTAFNCGLPDEQTIASYLQDYLSNLKTEKVAVYNFGQSGYFSIQERIFFEQLLISGYRPDLAIFIDGLNDFYFHQGQPKYNEYFEQLQQFVDEPLQSFKFSVSSIIEKLPITRLARFFGDLIVKQQEPNKVVEYNDPVVIDRVINRYLENKKMVEAIAETYAVTPIFVWQPVPNYKYDLKYDIFAVDGKIDLDAHNYTQYGYLQMAKINEEGTLGDDFFWCADMQETFQESLYVDKVHYTARMSQKLAEMIGNLLVERAFLYDKHN